MVEMLASLPPYADWRAGRSRIDEHLVLFGINMLLVPVGYYFAIRFGALGLIKAARGLLMVSALLWLLVRWQPARWQLINGRHAVLGLFVLANLAMLPFSVIPAVSLERLMTVIPFWLYTDLFAAYLRGRYGPTEGMRRFSWALMLAYLFPVLVFYVSGNPFAKLSIYGDESRGFVSNHFGWASAVSLACLLDARRRMRLGLWQSLGWGLLVAGCVWLLLVSGSRSGYLSAALCMGILVLAGKGVGWLPRVAIVGAALMVTLYLTGNEKSAVNQRVRKTETQLGTIEPRQLSAQQAFHALDLHEDRYLTGVGYGLYGEAIWRLTGDYPGNLHNSYLEMFIDCGAIVTAIFLLMLVAPALLRYLRYDARSFSFVPPLLIIPYFENNLGAGQFLFYPWMFLFFWYLHDTRWGRGS